LEREYMDNVIKELKPGHVVAAIDPALLHLQEYLCKLQEAEDYLKDKPDAYRLLIAIQEIKS